MNTLVKIVGFIALGVGVLIVGGIVLGMVTAALKMLVPIAILAAIGYVAWRVMSGSPQPQEKPLEEKKQQQLSAPQTQEKKGLSPEEAAKRFEELKKNQPT